MYRVLIAYRQQVRGAGGGGLARLLPVSAEGGGGGGLGDSEHLLNC